MQGGGPAVSFVMTTAAKAERARGERRLIAGMIAGAALTTFGPLLAMLASGWGVSAAMDASETVDPSQKARILAQGISEAMNFAMLGIPIGLLGFALAVGCAIALWRKRRREAQS